MITGWANSGGIFRPSFIYSMDKRFRIVQKKRVLLVGWKLGREVLVLCIGSVWFREKIWVTLFRLITAYFI